MLVPIYDPLYHLSVQNDPLITSARKRALTHEISPLPSAAIIIRFECRISHSRILPTTSPSPPTHHPSWNGTHYSSLSRLCRTSRPRAEHRRPPRRSHWPPPRAPLSPCPDTPSATWDGDTRPLACPLFFPPRRRERCPRTRGIPRGR